MSDWLKDYRQAWKTVAVHDIEERLSTLWPKIKADQKKDRWSTIAMSAGFIIATGGIIYVAASNVISGTTSLAAIAGMILLMALTSYLRVKGLLVAPDPGKSEKEHLDRLIDSYTLRLMMQRIYIWVYLFILNLLLILFFADSFYPEQVNTFIWATAGTLTYCGLVMLIVHRKRRRDIRFLTGIIAELQAIRKELEVAQE